MSESTKSSFFIINLFFVILIGVVFCYSYFFYPNNQPVKCVYKLETGKNCSSCGFSRAFSSFLHLKIAEGRQYNTHALPCFGFFLFQFFLRSFYILYNLYKKKDVLPIVIYGELSLTIILFLCCFFPLLNI